MALDSNDKLQNEAHDPMTSLPKRSYVDAVALQALIDRIGVLRQSLLDNDKAALTDALAAIEALKTELTGVIDDVKDALAANAEADATQAAEQAEIKTQVETNTNDIADLKEKVETNTNNHVEVETYNDFIEKDYNVFKTTVTDKLDEIIAAIQVVVTAADVESAYDAATADKAEDETPAE